MLEPQTGYFKTRVTDPFTGNKRRFNGWNNYWATMRFRHDVRSLGFSCGGDVTCWNTSTFHDIDEQIFFPGQFRANLWLEYQVIKGVTLRVEGENLRNNDRGRDRIVFDANGIVGGIQASRVLRERREGRQLVFSLKGTF